MPRKKNLPSIPKKNIAAIYCRVSTFDQTVGDFTSLDAQEESLKEWCKIEGWEVYKVYIEKGVSAKDTNRPKLKELRNDGKDGKFNLIVYTKMDRLSRNLKDWLNLIDEFEQLDISLKSKLEPMFNSDAKDEASAGWLLKRILMLFSEMEQKMTAERNFEKARASAKKGRYFGGTPPIGYEIKDKKLVVDTKYSNLLNRIYDEYLSGKKPQKIATDLNDEGYRTPSRTTKSGKNAGKVRGNAKFNKNNILSILSNETYIGVIKFHDETFKGLHSAIISKEKFLKVKKKRNLKAINPGKGIPKTSDLLLLDLLKCGYCGSSMTTTMTTKKLLKGGEKVHYYYKCSKTNHFGSKSCKGSQVTASGIEKFIIDWLKVLTEGEEKFKKLTLSTAIKENQKRLKRLKSDRKKINGNKSAKKKEMDSLLALARRGKKVPITILDEISSLETEINSIELKLANINAEIDIINNSSIQPKDYIDYLKEIVPHLETLNRNRLRDLIHLLIREISIEKPSSPDGKWHIKVSPWSYDPRAYFLDLLTGSRYRPKLLR